MKDGDKIITDLKTESVTVFLDGAEISKRGKVSLEQGNTRIVFSKLTSSILPESIRVASDGKVKVVSVVHNVNYLENMGESEKIESLKKDFEEAKYTISKLSAESKVLSSEWEILMLNREINKNESTKINEFQIAMEYFKDSMTRITTAQIENTKKLEDAREKYNAISRELNKYINSRKEVNEVHVEVYAEEKTESDFILSYYTYNARWKPLYDIRTSGDTNNINLVLKADVVQNTGEDWENVAITFSSGNPSVGANEPRLYSWRLNFYQVAPVESLLNMSSAKQKLESEYSLSEDIAIEESMDTLDVLSTVSENMSSLEFALNGKVSLENAEKRILDVIDYTLDADYKHYAVRKLEKDVFLLAVIKGFEKLTLLPGEVNIYLNNSFVGKTYLDPRTISENLEISLGRDKSVIVTRVKGTDLKAKTTFGSNIKDTRSFDITIRNLKRTPIKITVIDQIPISANKSIVVEVNEISDAVLNKETGELNWTLDLKAGESVLKKFKYTVTYPQNQTIILE